MTTTVKPRVAIVVSDPDLRDELARQFDDSGEVVTSLGDPGTLRLLRESSPSAVILDLDLDTFDALELLRLIGASPELRATPVIALSSRGDFQTFEKAHRLGAAEFVTKPFRPEDLRLKLDAVAAGRKQRSAGRLKLGALLVASGLVSQKQLDAALEHQRADGGRLGEVLVRDGIVSEMDIVNALAGQMRIGVVDLTANAPQPGAMGLLPRDFIVRHRLIPLRVDDNGNLVLAMTNPLDVISIDEVSMRTGKRVVPAICAESAFDEAVAVYFSSRGKLKDAREEGFEEGESGAVVDADIVEIVDQLLADATAMDASDIHLEPAEESVHVRCRIDGVLHDLREFPKELQPGITSRLKIMGNMNIAERRLPQDGRTSFELSSGEAIDVRLASIPSLYGENIALRILEQSPLPPTLASLGLSEETLQRYEAALKQPEGGIVICGPTGSGKSTTLYTTLELIKSPQKKIYTVEDPIERKIEGIIQTEVKPLIGLTFAQALRALVRADPDVIMVGEIRDLETAKMAADAAITGHQVFSTLHTNDVSAAVNRLVEMGVPRYLVAAAWRCFVAQRLVRRLCRHCREAETITDERWRELGLGRCRRARRSRSTTPWAAPSASAPATAGRVGLLRGARRRRRPARADRDRRHGARHPAPGADQGRRVAARGRRAQGARRQHELPRAAAGDRGLRRRQRRDRDEGREWPGHSRPSSAGRARASAVAALPRPHRCHERLDIRPMSSRRSRPDTRGETGAERGLEGLRSVRPAARCGGPRCRSDHSLRARSSPAARLALVPLRHVDHRGVPVTLPVVGVDAALAVAPGLRPVRLGVAHPQAVRASRSWRRRCPRTSRRSASPRPRCTPRSGSSPAR